MQIDLSRCKNIVVLTGAGISAGSGLRTYRGPGGVWEEHNVAEYGHARALTERPAATWRLFGAMREPLKQALPNAAHLTAGARTVHVNLEPMSPPNPAFRETYFGRAEEILPGLLGADA